jgi:predicted Zn-dependent peptidase
LSSNLHTLPNGLRVVFTRAPHLSSASVALAVRVGSRYERPEDNGISHFLEHMLFRGTAKHPTSHAWNDAFESLGGTLMASTTADHTLYDVTVPPEAAPTAIRLVAEIFDPILSHVETEKKVAREEILEHLDEDGRNVDADDLVHEAVFGTHPLGQPIMGSEENLTRFDRDRLLAWHREHYVAGGAVLAIAGRFDEAAALEAAREAFAGVPRGEGCVPAPFAKAASGPRFTYVDSVGAQTDVRIALVAPGQKDPRHPAADLMARILDDGMSARVFRTIVEDKGLAYEAFGELATYEDVGLYVLGASAAHESARDVTQALLEVGFAMRSGAIDPHELDKAKARARFALVRAKDDDGALAEIAATSVLFGEDHDLDVLAARLDAVTVDDVHAVAEQVFDVRALHVVAVGALDEAEEAAIADLVRSFRP